MADFAWLRVGQRPRTPSTPKSPTPPNRGPPRKPSHLSLQTRFSSSPEPLTSSSDTNLLIRDQDRIWYNPSLNQMVEALQVELMSHGAMQPVPVRFNAYILHLIEGFAHAQKQVRASNVARAGAEQSLEKHLEHFKSVADEWLEREAQYKAEIKRLEVLLARASSDGLEAVTLARTNSVIDRNGPQAKQFVSELKRISTGTIDQATPLDTTFETDERESGFRPLGVTNSGSSLGHYGSQKVRSSLSANLDYDNDFIASEKIRRQDIASDRVNPRIGDRRARRTRVVTPKPKRDTMVTAGGTKSSAGLAYDTPLFSDNMYSPSEASGKVELGKREAMKERRQPSRQILESLLACERTLHDAGENVLPPPRSAARPSSEHNPDQFNKDTITHDPDYRHLRSLSGFSFVTGDDAFTTSAGDGCSRESTRAAGLGMDSGNNIELRQYGGTTSQHAGDGFVKNRENRSSASSADTVIWTDSTTTVPDIHRGSPTAKRTSTPLLHTNTMTR